jgi:hypothetical protein
MNQSNRPKLNLASYITTEEAYETFGMMLGLFPPAAIFYQVITDTQITLPFFLSFLLILINLVCCLVGRWIGRKLGTSMLDTDQGPFSMTIIGAISAGITWAVFTGIAGGFLFFVVGAFIGFICAIPIGILGFLMFAPIHRILACDGLTKKEQFWPLACGVIAVIVTFILSPYVSL